MNELEFGTIQEEIIRDSGSILPETIDETARNVEVMLQAETVSISEPETISTPPVKKKRKASGFGKKAIAAAMIAAIGGSALGIGVGVGGGIYRQYTTALNEPVIETQKTQPVFTSTNTLDANDFVNLSNKTGGVVSIVKAVSNAVVSINVTAPVQTFYNQTLDQTGSGSGIIFAESTDKVYIATNNHVISGAKKVTISIDDTTEVTASFVGSDSQSDLAVISVRKEDLSQAGIIYKVAKFGNSDELEVGEAVVAIGNALGEGKTATLGIVSATNKKITIDGKTLNVIQTDAAINPGNSGGALADENGEIIGINTAKLSSSSIEGTGYSIPSNTAKKVIEDLMVNGSVQRPYLGIQGQSITEEMKKTYNLPSTGVLIRQVITDSSAQAAGLVASDIVVGFGSEKITTMEELSDAIAKTKVGDKVKLSIYRNGTTPMEITATIKNMNTETSF